MRPHTIFTENVNMPPMPSWNYPVSDTSRSINLEGMGKIAEVWLVVARKAFTWRHGESTELVIERRYNGCSNCLLLETYTCTPFSYENWMSAQLRV